MASGSAQFHENEARLTPLTRDLHRALVSLQEELEAIDWYQQRIDATDDGELREILRHNRDEEIEHAALVLEWIRRRSPEFDAQLRPRLFTTGPILDVEEALERSEQSGGVASRSAGPNGTATVGSPRQGDPWTT